MLPSPTVSASSSALRVLTVVQPLSNQTLARLRAAFPVVHYHPHPAPLPAEAAADTEVIFCSGAGLPPNVASIGPPSGGAGAGGDGDVSLPKLRHVQLASAGANRLLEHRAIKAYATTAAGSTKDSGTGQAISISTASGTHVLSIPPYVVGQIIGAWHQFGRMMQIQRNEQRWATGEQVDRNGADYYARSLKGRTVGLLGYGALGRETARLLSAFGMRILACNTSGKRTRQDGYIIPDTGDPTGAIPRAFYSTRDPASLEAFIRECDVLVASLPGTPDTAGLLDAEKLGWLKDDGVFVNVGRGTLIDSDELLRALSSPRLFAACLDVTSPEPLPSGHPLWTHPKCSITPHLSGDAEGEFDIAADVLLENVARLAAGKEAVNRVDVSRGY